MKEAAKFVRDFKSLAKEVDESIAKQKALELEIERLLREVVSHDIMSVVPNPPVLDTSNIQTELERFENSYNDMQQKIEWLQAQLGDLKGKSKDTPCVLDTLDPLSQKLNNENLELEFQVRNYEKENAHLKTAYKNLFDSINVSEQKDTTKGLIPVKLLGKINLCLSTKLEKALTNSITVSQPRSNTKNDRVPSASESSCIKNKEVE
ncbi:hypothetical protein Tco_0023095, partial [Tanacetum coccineum]